MARMHVEGLDELIRDFGGIETISRSTLSQMLEAEASVVLPKIENAGRRMGVYRTGQTLASLTQTRTSYTDNGAYKQITFSGTNDKGNRNAEVAFINEYGKTNQPARPFVWTGIEEGAGEAIQKATEVLDDFFKQNNF